MSRAPAYTREQILDAAMEAAHEHWRGATVAHVTARLGAPSGSIYHRFPSRDALFASAWLRSVHRFHERLNSVSAADPVEAIVETGLLIPRFCREFPLDARMLTVYRYEDLIADPPAGLLPQLRDLNTPVQDALRYLTARRHGRVTHRGLDLMRLACREAPMGIVRPRIGEAIPEWLDDVVGAATSAIASLDDTTH